MRHRRNNLRRLTILTLALAGLLPCATASRATRTAAPASEKFAPSSVSPTAPAVNGRIAFDSNRDGNHEIYTVSPDGGNLARLTTDAAGDFLPVWSPDGARIAFISTRDGNAEIYLMNSDGSDQRRLTNNPAVDEYPTWSPDGKQIAFGSERDGNYEIYVMNADGGEQTRITNNRADDAIPRWSPDGARLLFSSDRDGNYELYTMSATGGGVSRLTNSPGDDLVASWSPDGARIAFDTTRDDPNPAGCADCNYEIYVMNADGSNPFRITGNPAFDGDPAWSPDGTLIAFDSERDGNAEVYVVNSGGGVPVKLAGSAAIDELPDWQTSLREEGEPGAPALQFSRANYRFSERDGRAVLSITRTGDRSGTLTVEYLTLDDPAAVPCATANGTAYARCDYATMLDTVTFAPGETRHEISIPLVDDAHVEGNETLRVQLRNATGAAALGAVSTAALTIEDDDQAGAANPISTIPFFVRMQYLDFLSREPEAGEPWSGVLNRCPNVNNDLACDRILVSQSFFGSPEFRLKGFFVYNFYKAAFNRLPEYAEIIQDMRNVSGATPAQVYARRAALAVNFTQRQEFKGLYDAMSQQQYVDTLLDRYGLQQITAPDPANPEGVEKLTLTRAALAARLAGQGEQALTRAQVLRALVESDEVAAAEFNRAFVAMQYYGYLRRAPEQSGYDAWLKVINDDPGNVRIMVNGFMNSSEYRLRFGRP